MTGLALGKGGSIINRPLFVNKWKEGKDHIHQGPQGMQLSRTPPAASFRVSGSSGAVSILPSRHSALP